MVLQKKIKSQIDQMFITVGDMALKRRALRIIEELNLKNGDNVLDVGCGPGFYINILQKTGLKLTITGVDIDMNALESAKKLYKGNNIKIVYGDLMKKLPFKSNSFNKIILSEVAEHLPNDVRGLKEVYRVLKPGGVLILTVPNHNYPFLWDPVNWIYEHMRGKHIDKGVWAGIWANHIRLYEISEITSLLERTKFTIVFAESLTWWSLPFNHNLLYGNKFSPHVQVMVGSYIQKRSMLIKIILYLINLNDKMNDIIHLKKTGVCVFVKATK